MLSLLKLINKKIRRATALLNKSDTRKILSRVSLAAFPHVQVL